MTGPRFLRLDELTRRLGSAAQKQMADRQRLLANRHQRLTQAHPLRKLATQQRRLDGLQARLLAVREALVRSKRDQLERKSAVLVALSPRSALKRGYGIVRRTGTREALQSVRGIALGQSLEVLLGDGALDCRVEKLRPDA